MRLYTLVVAFSANYSSGQPLLLTEKDQGDRLPLLEAFHPMTYQQELFHQLKTIFLPDTIKLQADINYNYMDVANLYSIEYVKNTYDMDKETLNDSLIVTYGGILSNWPTQDNYQWSDYGKKEQFQGYSPNMDLNLLLDMVITRANV